MRVSVVMPFRNAEATIVAAVRSILEANSPVMELVAVSDRSCDASQELLREIGDPRIRVVGNEGAPGIVGALQVGIETARAPWIARMDADDVSGPGRIRAQLELAERDGLDVVTCGVRLLDACGEGMGRHVDWVNSLADGEAMSRGRFVECPLVHPTALMRRETLERVGGYREVVWAEDHDLWLRMFEAGASFGKVPEVHFDWRDSPGRLTRRDPRYGEAARMRMRAHFIARLEKVRANGVVIAGAGPIGKRLARALIDEGAEVKGFFEVNRRRIGQRIHGLPVAGSDEISHRWQDAVLLGAVGIPGGRETVLDWAVGAGRREGADFWAVC